jgi:hypothetical protein
VIGASGAIFGVMIATAMVVPDLTMLLFFIIPIRLKWLAVGYMAVTVSSLSDGSRVSHLTHLGGALGGYLLVKLMLPQYIAFDWPDILKLFRYGRRPRPVPRPRAERRHRPLDFASGRDGMAKGQNQAPDDEADLDSKIDPVLDKIGKHGMNSLTTEERRLLDQARERLRKGG